MIFAAELKQSSFEWPPTGGSGSAGDVVGPGSSTDNAAARFDGTTGKLIQNSVVIISDTGDVSGVGTLTAANIVDSGLTASQAVVTDASKQLASVPRGDLTDAGTDGITVTGGTAAVFGTGTSLSQHVADATHNGYLSSADWSSFNGKQASGNYITALTGDVTATGPNSAAATLATVNANVGTFAIATVTANAKGLITAASAAATTGSGSVVLATSPAIAALANLTTNGQVYVTGGNGTLNSGPLSGDITSAGAVTTLATVNSNVGSFNLANVTVNAKGLVTAASAPSTTGSGNVVLATSPTITTPSIAALANLTTNGYVKTSGGVGTLGVQAVPIPFADGGTGQTAYTDGQLLIGNTATGGLSKATITAGTNVTVTNGNGTITIAASGGGGSIRSQIRMSAAAGHGSTNNVIRRFVNTVSSTGTAITYTPSSTLGDTFTINTTGLYAISYLDTGGSPIQWGISVNSTQLTTSVGSITNSTRYAVNYGSSGSQTGGSCVYIGLLTAADVVRAHTNGTPANTADSEVTWVITQIGA